MSDLETKWIYQFNEPTDAALAEVGALLSKLPILPYTNVRRRRRRGTFFGRRNEAFYEGPLEGLLPALGAILKEDYANNTVEAPNVPYQFDYVVDSDASHANVLLIFTRLFGDEPGSILYGGPVMRIAKDYYIAWE